MKHLFLCILLLASKGLQSQTFEKNPEQSIVPYKLKLTYVDFGFVSLPTLKLHNEFYLGNVVYPKSLSLDVGYNFYSTDENTNVSGYYLGTFYNSYGRSLFSSGKGLSVGVFYQKTFLNDYLKVTKAMPGIGNYQEYEKMKYQKERYGFNISYFWQYTIYGPVFFEMNFGVGIVQMNTFVPGRVTQETFVNGLYYEKSILSPTVVGGFKLGYGIY